MHCSLNLLFGDVLDAVAVVLSLSPQIKGRITKREPVNIRLISIFGKGLVLGKQKVN